MKKIPSLCTSRSVEIYQGMLWFRRMFYEDSVFFKMSDFWEMLCEDSEYFSIKTYHSNQRDDYKRKGGVIAFNGHIILTVDHQLIVNAKHGCGFHNFMLAHEFGHIALDHYAKSAMTKNFQLFKGSNGMMSNSPPTIEELEADYAAVFFQCGVALEDKRRSAKELARRAFSDERIVEKAQSRVQLDVFRQRLIKRQRKRVILSYSPILGQELA